MYQSQLETKYLNSDIEEERQFNSRKLQYLEIPLPKFKWKEPPTPFPQVIELPLLPESEVIRWMHDDDRNNESRKIQILCQEWDSRSIRHGSFSDTPLPFSKSIFSLLKDRRWLTPEWAHLWHSDIGGSGVLMPDHYQARVGRLPGFILQTPNDGGPFCSACIMHHWWGTGGVFIADKNFDLTLLLSNPDYHSALAMELGGYNVDSKIAFTMLPAVIFEWHVGHTLKQLTKLKKRLAIIEEEVGTKSEHADYSSLSAELNRCSAAHLVLDRRWHFEIALAQHLLTYFEGVAFTGTKEYPPQCSQRVKLYLQLSEGFGYDLRLLPRRIKLQQTAIRNLVDLAVAKSTQQIAMESRRDSSSMKTIAILTLVFLPGTYVASFFSMTMFNWQANSGESLVSAHLWVYFIVTIPLTFIVFAIWIWWFRTQDRKQRIDLESPPSGFVTDVILDNSKNKLQ